MTAAIAREKSQMTTRDSIVDMSTSVMIATTVLLEIANEGNLKLRSNQKFERPVYDGLICIVARGASDIVGLLFAAAYWMALISTTNTCI